MNLTKNISQSYKEDTSFFGIMDINEYPIKPLRLAVTVDQLQEAVNIHTTPKNISLPYIDIKELLTKKMLAISKLNEIKEWINEDYDYPTNFIINTAKEILFNINDKYYTNFKNVFVNPYGTIEIIFESADKRIFSLEVGDDGFNYFIQLNDGSSLKRDISPNEINNAFSQINDDLIQLY